MIPNKDRAAVQGSIPGRSTRMTFEADAVTHIISILTDMYSDTELAVIRELATNARDSHVEAGNAAPIEVQTPTALSPYLIVRDRGVGLSVDELHDLYSKYGASTKRSTNEATGMLGIGSKSPLTYTSQFTLIAVKDGVRATVSISRDEDGVGNLTVVDTSRTADPNGVEIQVPAKSSNSFAAKAQKFFAFWRPGTVLLNGGEPARHDGIEITPSITLIKGDRYEESSTVVMGNVPYPDKEQLSRGNLGLPHGYQIIAEVPIGALDFAPSREALQYTSRTKKELERIAGEFKANLTGAINRRIQAATTRHEALRVMVQHADLVGGNYGLAARLRRGELSWRGVPFPEHLITDPKREIIHTNAMSYATLKAHTRTGAVDLPASVSCLFVTDYDEANFTPTHKKKHNQWRAGQPDDVRRLPQTIWLRPGIALPMDLVADWQVIDWATIKAEKLDYGRSGVSVASGRITGSYDIVRGPDGPVPPITQGTSRVGRRSLAGIPGDQIDRNFPVYWFHGNNQYDVHYLSAALDTLERQYTIVCLPANRIDKFRRENPKIEKLDDRIRREYAKLVATLSEAEKLAIVIDEQANISDFRALKFYRDEILDPEIVKCLDAAAADISKYREKQQALHIRDALPGFDDWESPLVAYGLWDAYALRSNSAEMIRYLNNEYTYRKAQK
jgi:hypothetical protein